MNTNNPKVAGTKELDAPVLLSSRDRNFLVTQGHEPDPLYVLAREWVQNPKSTGAATEARKRVKRPPGIRPPSIPLDDETTKIPLDRASVKIPEIDDEAVDPTLQTHLPRWKALGKLMRLEGAHQREIGMERLRQRLSKK